MIGEFTASCNLDATLIKRVLKSGRIADSAERRDPLSSNKTQVYLPILGIEQSRRLMFEFDPDCCG